MVNRHTSILPTSNTPTNKALGGHSIGQIDVVSYYKLKQFDKGNASYVYNVDKILSQFHKFQHLSTFDA
jgi:hypothetical protein